MRQATKEPVIFNEFFDVIVLFTVTVQSKHY